MAPANPKLKDALMAMREMSISDETTKKYLKKLLKLFENNWAPIEEDNFRLLADFIFDSESEEVEEHGAKKVNGLDIRAPIKQLHSRDDWEASPSAGKVGPFSSQPPLKKPKLEKRVGDITSDATSTPSPRRTEHPHNHPKEKQNQSASSPRSCHGQDCEELYHPMMSCRKSVIVSREKKPEPKRSSALYLTKEKPTGVSESMDELIPISVIHPGNSRPVRIEDDGFSGQQAHAAASLGHASIPESHSSGLEIASSEIGQMKISLQFNYAHERPQLCTPNLDAVFKMVEDKCIKSFKIVNPDFSIKKLMQGFCQSYLDAATETKLDKGTTLVNVTPHLDLLEKSSVEPKENHVVKVVILDSSLKSSLNGPPGVPRHISTNGFGFPSHITERKGKSLATTTNEKDGEDTVNGSQRSSSKSLMVRNQSECTLDGTNPLSLVVLNQSKRTLDITNPFDKVEDISKGQERFKITVLNEVCTEPFPPSFHYIPRNLVYQNAYIHFPLARIGDEACCSGCEGDCLSSPVPCECAGETGGVFGYTADGLVRKEFLDECMSLYRDPKKHSFFYCKDCPLERSKDDKNPEKCKGHLVRKFIKECWSKCGCHLQCGNRVVQRGISRELQVFFTGEGKGWGIRALQKLPRGAFVFEYVGEILTNSELYERNVLNTDNKRHTYPVLLDADWGSEGVLKDEEALCLDATYYGNVARFINHRCFDANLIDIPVEIETPDHHYYHIAFFTSREVAAMEELTWDYGIDFLDHDHPIKAFQCLCGSKGCRDIQPSTNRANRSK